MRVLHRNFFGLLACLFVLLFSSMLIAAEPAESPALEAEQAFVFHAKVIPDQGLELSWQIAPGYYLYQDKLQAHNEININILRPANLPPATLMQDPSVGNYLVYTDKLVVLIPWQDDFKNQDLLITYQGCKKDQMCYLPISKLLHINADLSVSVKDTEMQTFPIGSATDKIASGIANRNLFITMAVFFGFGLLLSFTPCVLPMIPLVINLVVGPKHISAYRAFVLSSTYVVGMAGSYALAGLFVGMLGATIQSWMQQPLVIIGFSLLLIVLALAQLDLIKVKLPHFNSRLHKWGAEQLQGSLAGAFILGIVAALIVSPCITPPLIGALTYITQDGNPLVGALTLMSLGLGMGVPLILVAVLSSKILPQAGRWMQIVKYITAIALIGLAVWLLWRLVPGAGTAHPEALPWRQVNTIQELDHSVHDSNNKYSLVDFYADWCVSCKAIDKEVFANPDLAPTLNKYNLIRVDLTQITNEKKQLLESLDIYGPPVILFYAPDGRELRDQRLAGEISASTLESLLLGLPGKS